MSLEPMNQSFDAPTHPPSNSRSYPFDFDENSPLSLPPPPATRGHQRARTAVDLPPLFTRAQSTSPTRSSAFSFLRPGSTRSLSPERVTPAEADEYAVQEPAQQALTKRRSGGLAAWFEGSSAPVNIGLVSPQKERLDPVEETEQSEEMFSQSQNPVDNLTARPSRRPVLAGPNTSTMSKFNIFRRSTTSLVASPEDIERLAELSVDETLFPHGRPDEYSPAAFKNLQMNAEGTIRRMQAAVREQRQSLRTITSTKNVQADELEAAETRNEHLKMQLEEMAARALEQEQMITEMRAQLAGRGTVSSESSPTGIRMVSQEDDQDPRSNYRRNRCSNASTLSESSSELSSVVSVFSDGASIAPSHATSVDPADAAIRMDCARCHGVRASDAWDVISVMKAESAALKQRIAVLETAHDDAMDFINGLKLS
jgi:hypothetical protein